ncbi:hypothetical protein TCAL_11609 [Tigriopus californicus]|uniref:N-acetyltransferase domain-containing protein n=1 Tax=Tigriopus californicus TaxID=6832 RepID=A0A553PDB9_TIGCA|nr:hypothetical protein TCAL_11609 [Tigriopus californicus]|eukprot:TCALIF_11609-PA protein Name:"Protein of unknown function" AED:0.15 eAED:0.15 QI:497/1/1/1/1/1/2/13/229
MFLPADLEIRPLRSPDQPEVHRMITSILADTRQLELHQQIKLLFLHPALWIFSGILIAVIGISLDSPPIPTSIVILVVVMMVAKRRFQTYWNAIKPLFDVNSPNLDDSFCTHPSADGFFLVATHRQRIVGTVSVVRTQPTCLRMERLFVHPACRRMGIATQLIQECITRSPKRWGQGLTLTASTASTQMALAKCLGQAGFQEDGHTVMASAYPLEFKTVTVAMLLDNQP